MGAVVVVVDLDEEGAGVTDEVAVDPVVEAAEMRRRSGMCYY